MRISVLVNPAKTVDAAYLGNAFAAYGVEADVAYVPPEELPAATRAVASGVKAVVAAGGDGTVSAVASALAGTKVPLGILPLGTFNHFARDLGIPESLEGAIQAFVEGVEHRRDVGEINGRIFINNSVLGIYPAVVEARRSRGSSRLVKVLATLKAGLQQWRHLSPVSVRLEAEGRSFERITPFVLVGTHAYELNVFAFDARSRGNPGHLHVYVARRRSRYAFLRLLLLALLKDVRDTAAIESWEVSALRIVTPEAEVPVFLDGEVFYLSSPLHYRLLPQALTVIAPAR